MSDVDAGERWKAALEEWALPEAILARAPESPWGFSVATFADAARRAIREPFTTTHKRIAESLGGGTLLDIGAGAGAASLPVRARAGRIVAVDQDPRMLATFADLARGAGHGRREPEIELVEGTWPEAADRVGQVDVTVCANVAYNVGELSEFVRAMTDVTKTTIVLELTERHPQSFLTPLWERFWGLGRPSGPTARDAQGVVAEVIGEDPRVEHWVRRLPILETRDPDSVSSIRRRLCLAPGRDDEVAQALKEMPEIPPTAMVTLWWPGWAIARRAGQPFPTATSGGGS
jgi:SAM-dependent methyltransferase